MTRICFRHVVLCVSILLGIGYAATPVAAQLPTAASAARWLFPRGNSEGTQSQFSSGLAQTLDSFNLKWSTNAIAGDVQPLIGNLINNTQLAPAYPYAPLEICAVIAGQLITLDATGRTATKTRLPAFVRSVSVILDSSSLPIELYKKYPSMLGLETIERRDTTDSLAVGYLAAYDSTADSIAILKNLSVDVRPYAPNLFASIKPVMALPYGADQLMIHAIVDMSAPVIPSSPSNVPFFRGMTSFLSGRFDNLSLATVSDTLSSRFTVGPSVNKSQASLRKLSENSYDCLLPSWPGNLDWTIADPFRPAISTYGNRPYLMSTQLGSASMGEGIIPVDLSPLTYLGQNSTRPRIENFSVQLRDAGIGGAALPYVLSAEEYLGRDSSIGVARLHLYSTLGDPITIPTDTANPSFVGRMNHSWAVAVGDVDGRDTNQLLPYYPNNPGNEIVVSQSTHEFAFPASRIMVLRYRSGTRIQKPAPRNAYLFPLDTVLSLQMTGWVACVTDLDNASDGRSEIFMADGSDLYVLHMRGYKDSRFTRLAPFDTLMHLSFPTEMINHVAVADIDGDGFNDVLVTTNVRCYLYGLPVQNSIVIVDPSRSLSAQQNYCLGDTLKLRWYNVFSGQPAVRVAYQAYRDGYAVGRPRILDSAYDNLADTVSFNLVVDSTFVGTYGRLLVQSTKRSALIDSSALVSFHGPSIRFDSSTKAGRFIAMDKGDVKGIISCLDSVRIYYSLDSAKTWTLMRAEYHDETDTSFWAGVDFPCPAFYDCVQDRDSLILLRAEGHAFVGSTVYSDTIAVVVRPHPIPLRIYPEPSVLCSERGILWIAPKDTALCDSIEVLESFDLGKTFHRTDMFDAGTVEYTYHPSAQAPDSVVVRICCSQSCWRTDTLLVNGKSKLIRKIAPNPFDPGSEVCEVFSVAPVDATVTVKIFDQKDHVVAEIAKNESRKAQRVYCDRWDGKTDDGKIVAIGMYFVVLEYGEGSREFYPVFVRRN